MDQPARTSLESAYAAWTEQERQEFDQILRDRRIEDEKVSLFAPQGRLETLFKPLTLPEQMLTYKDIRDWPFARKMRALSETFSLMEQESLTGEQAHQAYVNAWRMVLEARRDDPAVDAEVRKIYAPRERLPAPDDPPTPEQVIRRPRRAPRVATGEPSRPERFLTAADIQDWNIGDQVDVIQYAVEVSQAGREAQEALRRRLEEDRRRPGLRGRLLRWGGPWGLLIPWSYFEGEDSVPEADMKAAGDLPGAACGADASLAAICRALVFPPLPLGVLD